MTYYLFAATILGALLGWGARSYAYREDAALFRANIDRVLGGGEE